MEIFTYLLSLAQIFMAAADSEHSQNFERTMVPQQVLGAEKGNQNGSAASVMDLH